MDIIEEACIIIRKNILNIDAIYVFGSFSSDMQTQESDLDLAVLTAKKIDKKKLWKISQEIALRVKRDVDLIDLLEASTVFQFQIINEGKLLYCRDKKKCSFFENSIDSKYLELNQIRKEIIEDIQKRKEVY